MELVVIKWLSMGIYWVIYIMIVECIIMVGYWDWFTVVVKLVINNDVNSNIS